MNIAIKHQQPDAGFRRGTMVFHLPTKETLVNFPSLCVQSLELMFGYSLCHKVDQYNKKIGLDLANAKLQEKIFHLDKIENRYGRYVYHFKTYVALNDYHVFLVEVGISLINGSDNVRLEYAVMGD